MSPFRVYLGLAPAHLEALLGVGQEALRLLGLLVRGVVPPQLLGQEDPARPVLGQGLELGKGLTARGVRGTRH